MREVAAEQTVPLRREVLRGGRDHPPLGDGGGPGEVHLAVLDGDRVVSTGNVRPEPHPEPHPGPRSGPHPGEADDGWWRLRGMATDPAYRGRGAGAAVLDAVLDHVRRHGGRGLWCHARTGVRGWYERAGLAAEGEEWVDPDIGPHVRMAVRLR